MRIKRKKKEEWKRSEGVGAPNFLFPSVAALLQCAVRTIFFFFSFSRFLLCISSPSLLAPFLFLFLNPRFKMVVIVIMGLPWRTFAVFEAPTLCVLAWSNLSIRGDTQTWIKSGMILRDAFFFCSRVRLARERAAEGEIGQGETEREGCFYMRTCRWVRLLVSFASRAVSLG